MLPLVLNKEGNYMLGYTIFCILMSIYRHSKTICVFVDFLQIVLEMGQSGKRFVLYNFFIYQRVTISNYSTPIV